jgi:hypothetical protein
MADGKGSVPGLTVSIILGALVVVLLRALL